MVLVLLASTRSTLLFPFIWDVLILWLQFCTGFKTQRIFIKLFLSPFYLITNMRQTNPNISGKKGFNGMSIDGFVLKCSSFLGIWFKEGFRIEALMPVNQRYT